MTLPFENDTSRIVKRLAKQNMKANRRTSISIMAAILIASTFLCSLCTFVQSYWDQSVQQEIAAYGDWDAQLLEIHAGQLDLIQNNENIQTIMVKGDNQTALLPAASGLPYLLIQNCDGAYWGGMRENAIPALVEQRAEHSPHDKAGQQRVEHAPGNAQHTAAVLELKIPRDEVLQQVAVFPETCKRVF